MELLDSLYATGIAYVCQTDTDRHCTEVYQVLFLSLYSMSILLHCLLFDINTMSSL